MRREKWHSPDVVIAFLYALLFHVALFTIFRVAPPVLPQKMTPLSPISVEIDLSSPVEPKAEHSLSDWIEPPELSGILLPSHEAERTLYYDFPCREPDFSDIETLDYTPLDIEFDDD